MTRLLILRIWIIAAIVAVLGLFIIAAQADPYPPAPPVQYPVTCILQGNVMVCY